MKQATLPLNLSAKKTHKQVFLYQIREFAQLQEFGRLPDEFTILRFRHRLEKHNLAEQILQTVNALLTDRGLLLKVGTAMGATLIAAPALAKNRAGVRAKVEYPFSVKNSLKCPKNAGISGN